MVCCDGVWYSCEVFEYGDSVMFGDVPQKRGRKTFTYGGMAIGPLSPQYSTLPSPLQWSLSWNNVKGRNNGIGLLPLKSNGSM